MCGQHPVRAPGRRALASLMCSSRQTDPPSGPWGHPTFHSGHWQVCLLCSFSTSSGSWGPHQVIFPVSQLVPPRRGVARARHRFPTVLLLHSFQGPLRASRAGANPELGREQCRTHILLEGCAVARS